MLHPAPTLVGVSGSHTALVLENSPGEGGGALNRIRLHVVLSVSKIRGALYLCHPCLAGILGILALQRLCYEASKPGPARGLCHLERQALSQPRSLEIPAGGGRGTSGFVLRVALSGSVPLVHLPLSLPWTDAAAGGDICKRPTVQLSQSTLGRLGFLLVRPFPVATHHVLSGLLCSLPSFLEFLPS